MDKKEKKEKSVDSLDHAFVASLALTVFFNVLVDQPVRRKKRDPEVDRILKQTDLRRRVRDDPELKRQLMRAASDLAIEHMGDPLSGKIAQKVTNLLGVNNAKKKGTIGNVTDFISNLFEEPQPTELGVPELGMTELGMTELEKTEMGMTELERTERRTNILAALEGRQSEAELDHMPTNTPSVPDTPVSRPGPPPVPTMAERAKKFAPQNQKARAEGNTKSTSKGRLEEAIKSITKLRDEARLKGQRRNVRMHEAELAELEGKLKEENTFNQTADQILKEQADQIMVEGGGLLSQGDLMQRLVDRHETTMQKSQNAALEETKGRLMEENLLLQKDFRELEEELDTQKQATLNVSREVVAHKAQRKMDKMNYEKQKEDEKIRLNKERAQRKSRKEEMEFKLKEAEQDVRFEFPGGKYKLKGTTLIYDIRPATTVYDSGIFLATDVAGDQGLLDRLKRKSSGNEISMYVKQGKMNGKNVFLLTEQKTKNVAQLFAFESDLVKEGTPRNDPQTPNSSLAAAQSVSKPEQEGNGDYFFPDGTYMFTGAKKDGGSMPLVPGDKYIFRQIEPRTFEVTHETPRMLGLMTSIYKIEVSQSGFGRFTIARSSTFWALESSFTRVV